MPLIRTAHSGEIAHSADIDARHVRTGAAICETEPPTASDAATRHAEVALRGLPCLPANRVARAGCAGVHKRLSLIGDPANAAPMGLYRRAGFSHAAAIDTAGRKFGRWLDAGLTGGRPGSGLTTAAEKATS